MTSRVAKNPVTIPNGVEVTILDNEITVKGKLGSMSQLLNEKINVNHQDNKLLVSAINESADSIALSGTYRALLQNMVSGVTNGFTKKLILVGVGYRAKVQGNDLDLTVGLSHPMIMKMPEGIKVETPSNTEIVLTGIDKQKVCQVAANIRAVRPPEPYKGKGIRYENEQVSLKEGKKK